MGNSLESYITGKPLKVQNIVDSYFKRLADRIISVWKTMNGIMRVRFKTNPAFRAGFILNNK